VLPLYLLRYISHFNSGKRGENNKTEGKTTAQSLNGENFGAIAPLMIEINRGHYLEGDDNE